MASKSLVFGRRSRVSDEAQDGADANGPEDVEGGEAVVDNDAGQGPEGSGAATSPAKDTAKIKAKGKGKKPRKPRPTVWEQTGGLVGLFISSFPVTVFSLVNTRWGLKAGICAAMGTAVFFFFGRLIFKQTIQPAISGFIGIAISSSIAYATGTAKGYFLFDIWFYLGCLTITVGTLVIRRPLAGLLWSSMSRRGALWRKDKTSLHGYDIATVAWAMVFGSRFVVQHWLYDNDLTGWLAFAKIMMGFPLTLAAFAAVIWAVRRSDKRLKKLEAESESEAETEPEPETEETEAEATEAEATEAGQETGQEDGAGRPEAAEPAEPAGSVESAEPPESAAGQHDTTDPTGPTPAASEEEPGRVSRLKPSSGTAEASRLDPASVPGEAG